MKHPASDPAAPHEANIAAIIGQVLSMSLGPPWRECMCITNTSFTKVIHALLFYDNCSDARQEIRVVLYAIHIEASK